jgi:hypothetical protein
VGHQKLDLVGILVSGWHAYDTRDTDILLQVSRDNDNHTKELKAWIDHMEDMYD